MKFFAPSHLLQSYPLMSALEEILQLGFAGSEIWYEHLAQNKTSAKRLREFPLAYTFHAPSWDVNPASRIKPVRDFAQEHIIKSLDFAAAIESRMVTFHPGHKSNPKNEFEVYEGYLHEFLDRITIRATELGLPLAMEIMDSTPNQLVNSPAVANELSRLFPTLGICFDVAHGGRFTDPIAQLEEIERTIHIHLSNTTLDTPHTPLDEGVVDIANVLRYIEQNLPDIIIAVEGFDPEAELELVKKNRAYLQKIGFWN